MKNDYGHNFYVDRHQKTVYSARSILALVLDALPPVHSAIDLGCGVGTWLSVLKEKGVSEIRGLDGPWVEQNLLEIPTENFQTINFEKTVIHERRYDLAITLEVAEHISKESASSFVDSLVSASDFVLFSAAIPFQGGTGHINEQWPDYWADIFAAKDYVVVDFVRQKIWNDKQIPFWYRQNIVLFVKKERISSIRLNGLDEPEYGLPIALVHPDLYLSKISKISKAEIQIGVMSSVRGSLGLFRRAVKTWVKKRISKNSEQGTAFGRQQ